MIRIGSLCFIQNVKNPACSHLTGRVCEIVGAGTLGFKWTARINGYAKAICGDDRHFLPIDDPDSVSVTTRELQAA